MKTKPDTPEVHTPSRIDGLLKIRTIIQAAVSDAEAVLGIEQAFPVTVRLAAALDELAKLSTAEGGQ